MQVTNVKFVNDKVEIVLGNNSFFMSKENYIENPITIDSFVSKEKIDYLKKQEKIIEIKMEMIKLLNKRMLSESEIKKKIKEKELNTEDTNTILESLKRLGLINDSYFAELLVDKLLFNKKGKLEIYKELTKNEIKNEIIANVMDKIDEDMYRSNFCKVCEKYEKIYNKKSLKMKKQMIVNKLRECGYEDELISSVNFKENSDKELGLAKICLCKILKNKKLDLNNYENVNKIRTKLMVKGFSYDIINLALKEVSEDETY